ncbi:hypothetical protein FRC00_011198 [Tulasnella sp. 408]|nr:hypothetical protein FRC00_011198 [Tulasnella sp. 408]
MVEDRGKMKIDEPEKYDGKNRGGDVERFLSACKNYFKARAKDFPNDEAKIQFTLTQAWGENILRDLLGSQMYMTSMYWKKFEAAFVEAFGDPDKEGTDNPSLRPSSKYHQAPPTPTHTLSLFPSKSTPAEEGQSPQRKRLGE